MRGGEKVGCRWPGSTDRGPLVTLLHLQGRSRRARRGPSARMFVQHFTRWTALSRWVMRCSRPRRVAAASRVRHVVSATHCVARVSASPGCPHLVTHTPMRYVWTAPRTNSGRTHGGSKRWVCRSSKRAMRAGTWPPAQGAPFAAQRIRGRPHPPIYGREGRSVPPPVETDFFLRVRTSRATTSVVSAWRHNNA